MKRKIKLLLSLILFPPTLLFIELSFDNTYLFEKIFMIPVLFLLISGLFNTKKANILFVLSALYTLTGMLCFLPVLYFNLNTMTLILLVYSIVIVVFIWISDFFYSSIFNTVSFGYLATKWKRLIRVLFVILLSYFYYTGIDNNYGLNNGFEYFLLVYFCIYLFSWVLEPFIKK
jgi:hypothetical protein